MSWGWTRTTCVFYPVFLFHVGMPFYLRKYFSAGPLRINLSKGGVGLSAGVTGARVGINRKGAYVHGGRHGLYYRKHLRDSNGRSRSRKGSSAGSTEDGPVDLFKDTGASYPALFDPTKREPEAVTLPALPGTGVRITITLVLGGIAALIIGANTAVGGGLVMLLTLGEVIRFSISRTQKNNAAESHLDTVETALLEEGNPKPLLSGPETSMSAKQRAWLDPQCYSLLVGAWLDGDSMVEAADVEAFEASAQIASDTKHLIKKKLFASVVDSLVEDGVLTEEEEEGLQQIASQLDLQPSDVPAEHAVLEALRAEREVHNKSLTPMDVDVRLKRNEECYYTSQGRFLVERVQERFQRNKVKYTVRGLEVDMEGPLYLTERRIFILGDGMREYRLHRVMKEELSLEDNTLRLTLDGRVSPLILSTPQTHVLAAYVTKVLKEHHGGV